MKLINIQLKGFRLFQQPVEIDFQRLTMLIGNNDSGKSSILDILQVALTLNGRPDENDFYTSTTRENAEKIEIILQFEVDPEDEDTLEYATDNTVVFRAIYTRDNVTKEYAAEVPVHDDLRVNFPRLSAAEQRAIIEKYEPNALSTTSNSDNRTEWFIQFIKTIEKVKDWRETPADFQKILPRIQRYGAMDYETPEKLINQTVRQVFETVLYEELAEGEEGDRELKKSLRDIEVEAEQKINEKVSELKEYIHQYAPTITNISYEPQIDFTRGFQPGDFKVDEGRGEHYLNKSGDGTKRKIFMATTDWDRDVTLAIQAEGGSLPDIIRAYDEPDTNLDYHAQRQLFNSISEISTHEKSNIQAIICTHSPRLIDRAPAQNLRMLKKEDEKIVVEKLETFNDVEIEFFLTELARELGITNSLMFYENCFILIEGDTEQNALPLFYRTLYKRSLIEDGINIINVRGKSAFKEFLRLLSQNKKELVLFLMDQDCSDSKDDKMTEQVLKENGFTKEFCDDRIRLVGRKEFEDLFSSEILAKIYNEKWPKTNGDWTVDDFNNIDSNKKFSDELLKIVWENCDHSGNNCNKPELGKILGEKCGESEIPQEVKDLFMIARQIANIS